MYVCVHIYISIYVCIRAYVRIYVYACVYIYACACVFAYVSTHSCRPCTIHIVFSYTGCNHTLNMFNQAVKPVKFFITFITERVVMLGECSWRSYKVVVGEKRRSLIQWSHS